MLNPQTVAEEVGLDVLKVWVGSIPPYVTKEQFMACLRQLPTCPNPRDCFYKVRHPLHGSALLFYDSHAESAAAIQVPLVV